MLLRSLPALCFLAMLAAGCTTINYSAHKPVPFAQEWVVLPFLNNTETPYAAERAESVATVLLYGRGLQRISHFPAAAKDEEQLLPDRGTRRLLDAQEWARKKGVRYALTGTVTEWRYKVGLDGEPVAGVTLQVLDLQDGSVLWSGSGSKSGWSRDAVSAVAQQVMDALIRSIPIETATSAP